MSYNINTPNQPYNKKEIMNFNIGSVHSEINPFSATLFIIFLMYHRGPDSSIACPSKEESSIRSE